jgi:hypothetical protein
MFKVMLLTHANMFMHLGTKCRWLSQNEIENSKGIFSSILLILAILGPNKRNYYCWCGSNTGGNVPANAATKS